MNDTKYSNSHAELMADYLTLFSTMRFDEWTAKLWHPQGKYILAYPSNGFPTIIANNREQLLNSMKNIGSSVSKIDAKNLTVTPSTDQDLFFATYEIEIKHKSGVYKNNIMYKIRLQDNLIVELTEYYDRVKHEDFLRAIGFLK
ncbi:hypothetical protein IC235_09885 [Hymenobacter sp. BT664]|uniref:SnoaL-like domain-containing protein n=1 Tax=Hymenobacter montanus TaxID=2771359 RepID=A0A927BCE0_9BACT|nr:hypothetical protein [Hymenobacter montanus]MBD2768201.1 hypothetical protein [Hymenobacter montanus]